MDLPPKVDRRGGYRPNAGRKPAKELSLSTQQVAKMLRKAKNAASRYGKDVDDVLLEMIYTADLAARDKISAIKLWKACTLPKIAEGGETDKALGPAVFLPDQRPVLSVVEGGKKGL